MNNTAILLRLPPKLLKALRAEAKESETTVQTIIRRFVHERLKIRHREEPVDPFLRLFSTPRKRRY